MESGKKYAKTRFEKIKSNMVGINKKGEVVFIIPLPQYKEVVYVKRIYVKYAVITVYVFF